MKETTTQAKANQRVIFIGIEQKRFDIFCLVFFCATKNNNETTNCRPRCRATAATAQKTINRHRRKPAAASEGDEKKCE
eukprot:666246-Pyramimonas_sp.AAC.1